MFTLHSTTPGFPVRWQHATQLSMMGPGQIVFVSHLLEIRLHSQSALEVGRLRLVEAAHSMVWLYAQYLPPINIYIV